MAGQVRHLKVKGGRFYARVAVPTKLQSILGKKELTAPLGPDRREAMRALAVAVAALQAQISHAKGIAALRDPLPTRNPITTQDYGVAVWQRYMAALADDDATRAAYPSAEDIAAAKDEVIRRFQREGMPGNSIEVLTQSIDWHVKKGARDFDQNARRAKLDALRDDLTAGRTHLVEHEIDDFLTRSNLTAPMGSAERAVLAKQVIRAIIAALERTLERDQGNYGGQPSDPIVKPPSARMNASATVKLGTLWRDYVKSRQALGSMRDSGRRQQLAVDSLQNFLKHDDAAQITKKDMADWLDHALTEKAASTISKVYLPTLRSLFRWAVEKDKLPSNPAETIRLRKPKQVHNRERGYTDPEAVKLLQFCRDYTPKTGPKGKVLESPRMTAAKRWVPLLCAFTGARVAEITQLRREDFRKEGEAHVARITPEAGGTKTGQWRDVPLHRQIIALGFLDFLESIPSGPIFHTATDPALYILNAKKVANRIGDWLRESEVVPAGVQPSHGWRHRFKTISRDIGADGRVTDAIQGHASRTSADDYGDVSLIAKARVIDALPDYDLS